MNKMLEKLIAAYRLNARMYNLALTYFGASLIIRFPWLITSWVPVNQQSTVFSLADSVTTFILVLLVLWVKDKTVSGNGSEKKPFEKSQP